MSQQVGIILLKSALLPPLINLCMIQTRNRTLAGGSPQDGLARHVRLVQRLPEIHSSRNRDGNPHGTCS